MKISLKELKNNRYGKEYSSGYRIVSIYDKYYSVGEYCKTIEGFMLGFAKTYPIMDDCDVPPFISNDDLLDRYLNEYQDLSAVAIYNVDGTCIDIKKRDKI